MAASGIPSQLAALRKELAEARADLEHVLTVLGDVLRDLDGLARCSRITLKVARHVHQLLMKRKPGRRGAG